jgi:hypothetical protein
MTLNKVDNNQFKQNYKEHLLEPLTEQSSYHHQKSYLDHFLTKYYTFIAIFAGINMGSFNFL